MKTKLFKDYDLSTQSNKEAINGLKRDFVFLFKIKKQNVNDFLNDYANKFIERNTNTSKELRKNIEKKFNLSEHDFSRIDNLLEFFIKHFLPSGTVENEKIEFLIDDLLEMEIIKEDNKSLILQILDYLKEKVDTIIKPEFKRIESLRSSNISLDYLVSKTGLKAIFDKELNFGEKKPNYSPKCIGFISVANMQLQLADHQKTLIHFTCDKIEIEKLITTLQNTLMEMKAAEKFANLD